MCTSDRPGRRRASTRTSLVTSKAILTVTKRPVKPFIRSLVVDAEGRDRVVNSRMAGYAFLPMCQLPRVRHLGLAPLSGRRPMREMGDPFMASDRMIAARAAALFASDLSSRGRPTQVAVAAATTRAIAPGERPETAVPRMRWARQTIDELYSPAVAASGSVLDLDEMEGTSSLVSSTA
jgi:hypothetical protein